MTRSTWTAFHHRGDVLRGVADEADLRRDGTLPWHLDGVVETFHDRLDLIGALQLRWHTRLAGRIDHELTREPMDLESAVRRAWIATAENLPGIRAILDRQTAAPESGEVADALGRATDSEHAMLALMAGRSSTSSRLDRRAVQAGRAIEEAARASYRPALPMPDPARAHAVRVHPAASLAPMVRAETPAAPAAPVTAGFDGAIEHAVPQSVPLAAAVPASAPTTEKVPSGSADFVARMKAALAAA